MQKYKRKKRSRPGVSALLLGVVERLRADIIAGRRAAGSKLSEPTLAAEHGVSRGPAREALRQLEREGLVVFDAVGRSSVVSMTPADFEDLFVIRAALEGAAAAHAARGFDAGLRHTLEANIASMSRAATLADVTRLDLEFHEAILVASGRRRLIASWLSIRSQLALWLGTLQRAQDATTADVQAGTLRAHRQLLKVLASGDAERSRREAIDQIRCFLQGLKDADPGTFAG